MFPYTHFGGVFAVIAHPNFVRLIGRSIFIIDAIVCLDTLADEIECVASRSANQLILWSVTDIRVAAELEIALAVWTVEMDLPFRQWNAKVICTGLRNSEVIATFEVDSVPKPLSSCA